jgi:hypothetical protein
MAPGSYLMYRCRLCNESFADGHAPDGPLALDVASGRLAMPPHWAGLPPGTRTLHHECSGGSSIGIADLIGIVPDGWESD